MSQSQYFSPIKNLILAREKCVFCQAKLKVILTNGMRKGLPVINAKYIDELFQFNLKYNSASLDLNFNVILDPARNNLIFDKLGPNDYDDFYGSAITVFTSMAPHIELYCSSRKCGLKYYLTSENLCSSIFMHNQQDHTYLLLPTRFTSECLNVFDFWIQNDMIANCTNIYSTHHPSREPIVVDTLDFVAMGKEKLIKRIQTLVTFS